MVRKKYIVIKLMVLEGIVYKSTGSWYLVKCNNDFFECRIKGKIRLKGVDTTNPIAVGDNVIFEKDSKQEGLGIISEILPRKNYIIRKSVKLSKQSHIIASNIDLTLLLITKDNPSTSLNFIDRFLVTCEAYQIPVILVFVLEVWPLRSTGSLFTTWTGTLFWLNAAMLYAANKKRSL